MLKERSQSHKRKHSELELYHPQEKQINTKSKCKNIESSTSQNMHSHSKKKSDMKFNSKPKNSKNFQQHNKNPLRLNLRLQNQNSNTLTNCQNIAKLVSNSQRKYKEKYTLVQNIQQGENKFFNKDRNFNNHQNNQNFDSSNQNTNANQNSQNFNKSLSLNNQNQNNGIFCFGKGHNYMSRKPFNNLYEPQEFQMEEIMEVPDTMSCQRRYKNSSTKYQSLKDGLVFAEDSQNNIIMCNDKKNREDSFEKFRKKFKAQQKLIDQTQLYSQLKKRNLEGEEIQQKVQSKSDIPNLLENYKKNNKKSKKLIAENKRQSMQNCKTNSTICLSQTKSRHYSQKNRNSHKSKINNRQNSSIAPLKSKSLTKSIQMLKPTSFNQKQVKTFKANTEQQIRSRSSDQQEKRLKALQNNNQKVTKQIKMLWQCMGQLWQSNRIARYITQRNKLNIQKILKKQQVFDSNLINMKAQIIRSIGSSRY